MIRVAVFFSLSLSLSLCLVPCMIKLGARWGAMDLPDARKVHTRAISRLGGVAIFLSFSLVLSLAVFYSWWDTAVHLYGEKIFYAFLGAAIAFAVGLIDDLRRLGYTVKFAAQVLAATVAYVGGLQIEHIGPFGFSLNFAWLSYPVTVFWFLLFMNAVNLADGLDGLAGGVVFFACAMMVIMLTIHGDPGTVIIFATLAGAVLGFLRYNFNPATIFMGDSGSYFLGYTLAATAILSSVKSELSALLLIPLVSLGVPIFDTMLSPVRRFIVGRDAFSPDMSHIHHRLLEMGLSTRKTVLLIYGLSVALGMVAIGMVSFRSELRGGVLIILAVGIYIFIRKLRYFEYFTAEKVYGWLIDMTDASGFSQERRSFLSIQMDIAKSRNLEELWQNVRRAVDAVHFDMAEFIVKKWGEEEGHWIWVRDAEGNALISSNIMQLRLPLMTGLKAYTGVLLLSKDLTRAPLHSYALRRVEHLRRAIKDKLRKMDG